MATAVLRLDFRDNPAADGGALVREARGVRLVTLLRLSLVLIVVGQLGRIPVLAAGKKDAPILVNDLVLVAVLCAGLIAALRRRTIRLDWVAGLALLFASVGALSALLAIPRFGLSVSEFFFSIAYLVRWLAYFAIYLFVINFVGEKDIPSVWRALEWAVLIFTGFGIIQSAFLPNFAQIIYPESVPYQDWDIQKRRLVSSFLDPNFAGGFILIALFMNLARLSYGLKVAQWKIALLFAGLVLTLSRGSLLAFICGGMYILVSRGVTRRMLRLSGVLFMVFLPLLPIVLRWAILHNKLGFGDASALSRVVAWLRALEILVDHPVLGIGFNTYGFVQQKVYGFTTVLARASFGLEGGLLFVAVMTGVVGATLYGAMYALVIRRCRHVWRDQAGDPEDRGFCLGVATVTVALLVHSLFLNTLLYPFIMHALWVLWGLAAVIQRPRLAVRHAQAGPRSCGPGATVSGRAGP